MEWHCPFVGHGVLQMCEDGKTVLLLRSELEFSKCFQGFCPVYIPVHVNFVVIAHGYTEEATGVVNVKSLQLKEYQLSGF